MATLSSRPTVQPDVTELARTAATPVVNVLKCVSRVFVIRSGDDGTAAQLLLEEFLNSMELDDWLLRQSLSTSLHLVRYEVAVKHKPDWPFVLFDLDFRVV